MKPICKAVRLSSNTQGKLPSAWLAGSIKECLKCFLKMKENMFKIAKEAYGTKFSLLFFLVSFREKERGGRKE